MYTKFQIYLQTVRGNLRVASIEKLHNLRKVVTDWLENTPEGRSIDNNNAKSIILYDLNPNTKTYRYKTHIPVESRQDIINKIEQLKK